VCLSGSASAKRSLRLSCVNPHRGLVDFLIRESVIPWLESRRASWYPVTMQRQAAIDAIRAHEAELRALGVAGCALFGSVARGEAGPDSDIDVAVRLDEARRVTLFGLAEVSHRLEAMLGTKVDLVSEAGLRPRFRAQIEADRVHVF
jgi:uncharacterized protein